MIPKKKTKVQERIYGYGDDLELDVIFKEFMLVYLRLYRDTGNKEYKEMAGWIGKKKKEIIVENKEMENLLANIH